MPVSSRRRVRTRSSSRAARCCAARRMPYGR